MIITIIGGGVMGTCLAHFLVEYGAASVTVVEKHKVACAASGRAGGFLARDWCRDNPALDKLASVSFDLHKELSLKFNGKEVYDYRPMKAFSIELKSEFRDKSTSSESWLNGSGVDLSKISLIGSDCTVAQLHPYKFTKALTDYNTEKGVKVIEGQEVCGIKFEENESKVSGVLLTKGQSIYCDVVVIAMGPWSGVADQWFPHIPAIHGQKAHSITVRPSQAISAEAVFVHMDDHDELAPELYPRPDGEVYICGMAENPIPSNSVPSSSNVTPTLNSCEKIKSMSDLTSSFIRDGQTTCSQACYMPLTQDGLPVIGKLNGVEGLYMAAGHGCWGILNSPATGKALAELILNKSSAVDLKPFCPNRF